MRWLGTIAIAGALAGAMPAHAQSVRAGIEAWQKSDYAGAVAIWRPLAEKGDADAAFNLGQAYRLGRGVKVNLAAAQTWLERAADKDHLEAQTTLGLLLFDSGNRVTGIRWLRTAAERGEPRAALIYGTALFNGDSVVRDPVRAYAYVSRAAAQGLAPAKETLAELDKLMPLAERKRGLAIAMDQAGAKPAAKSGATRVAAAKLPSPKAPQPRPAEKAAPKVPASAPSAVPATGGGWRIQLGAFSQRGSAEALFRKLAGGPLAGKQPTYVAAGAVTRLQAGPYPSKPAAAAACAALSARGQPCFVVAAK